MSVKDDWAASHHPERMMRTAPRGVSIPSAPRTRMEGLSFEATDLDASCPAPARPRAVWSQTREDSMSRATLVAVTLSLLGAVAPTAASAASRIPSPRPPQNPNLAANPGNNIHNDTWMTDAYARSGPTGPNLVASFGAFPLSICGSMTFDRQGHIVTVCPRSSRRPRFASSTPARSLSSRQYVLPDAPAPAGTLPSRISPAAATSSLTRRTASGAQRRPTTSSHSK